MSDPSRAGDPPVVDPEDLPGGGSDPGSRPGPGPAGEAPTVVGVLLAAGRSRRFEGGNKLLADLEGEPVVRRAARTLLAADLAAVLAVVGHEAGAVARAIRGAAGPTGPGRGLAVVGNPRHGEGQSTSVAAGVRAACGADAAVFALGDMPRVRPATVRTLVRAYRAGAGDALAAAHRGRRGNPVLFDARHFPALADVTGDTGGRAILLSGEHSALVETGDPGVRRDVDTARDLERIEGGAPRQGGDPGEVEGENGDPGEVEGENGDPGEVEGENGDPEEGEG